MHSLKHLKENYRARYWNKQGENKVPDIQQGENVLKYIQDCFRIGAEGNIVCSPSMSCCSSPGFSQTLSHRKENEQIEPEADKIIYVQNVFNTDNFLPSSEEDDISTDVATLKGSETPSSGHVDSTDEDGPVAFAIPVLLQEDEEESSGETSPVWQEEAPDEDLQSSRDARKSEGHHARKETKKTLVEDPKHFAISSCQKKIPESIASLNTMIRSSSQRNAASEEPEDECEFLIEESFGLSSPSWVSLSQKKKNPQKISLKSASSEAKKRDESGERQNKRTSQKLVTPAAAKEQSKLKLIHTAERTLNGMQNVSRTSGRTAVVDGQSQLTVNTIQRVGRQTRSKSKPPVGICNEDCNVSAGGNHAEDPLLLLEQDRDFSLQPQPIVSTTKKLSQRKQSTKQNHSKVKPLVVSHDEGCQDSERIGQISASDHEVPLSVISKGEQLPCSQKLVKQKHLKRKPSVEIHEDDIQERSTTAVSSQDCQEATSARADSEDRVPVRKKRLSKRQQSITPTAQRSSHRKSVKRQKPPKTTPPPKHLETPVSSVKKPAVRRKNKVLVLSDSCESGHGGEQGNEEVGATGRRKRAAFSERISESKRGEEGENPCEQITEPRKTLPQKVRPTGFANAEESGIVFYQEDYSEQYIAKKKLGTSVKQKSSNTRSLQDSCTPDVNMNNVSVPVSKTSSKRRMAVNREESTSDESEDLEEEPRLTYSNALKRKMVLPSNTPNVRRTKRMRIKPLEYWRGERVKYKIRPSGGLVIDGVISPEQREPRKPKPKRTINPVLELENMSNSSVVSLKNLSQPAVVFDKATNKEVLVDCVSNRDSHLLFISNDTVSIYKHLNTPFFSTGKLILKPLKEKGLQYSHTDTLVFHISSGKLLLTLYDQCYHLAAGDYFFIPPGNVYNVRNLLNKECVVLFTQIKGNSSENE